MVDESMTMDRVPPVGAIDHDVPSEHNQARVFVTSEPLLTFMYESYVERVYRYAFARLGNQQDAQDVTAQTFLAAVEGIATYRDQGKPAAWLFGIAKRTVAMFLRQRRATVGLHDLTHVPHTDPLPDEIVEEQLQREQIVRALQDLAPDRAEAYTLRVFAGLTTAEIAGVMGRSEDAVRMLIHRAVRNLRDVLQLDEETLQ